MTRLRVALDARSLQDEPIGGIGRSTRAVVEALRDHVDLVLLTDARRPRIETDLPQRALRAPLSRVGAAWLQIAAPGALQGFDGIFHCPWYGLPFRQPVPMVVTIYDLGFEDQPVGYQWHQRLAFKVQARWAARTAGHILTGSSFVRQQICSLYRVDATRITVQPSPIDPRILHVDEDRFRRIRERAGTTSDYVVAIGGAQRRRLDLALAAWPEVRAQSPGTTLVVLGGPKPTELPAGVIALGGVDDETWAAVLAGARALLYPTQFEGFGYPALEALALGVPIVCFRREPLTEVVGDAASWIERPDPDAVARAVLRVLSDPGYASELASAGRARAARAADLQPLRDVLLDAYDRATGREAASQE